MASKEMFLVIFSFVVSLSVGTANAELNEGHVTFSSIYPVQYTIENGQLSDIELNTQENSITAKLDMDDYGSLVISIPRDVMDSKVGIFDSNFSVSVNYLQVDFREVDTGYDEYRTLIIPLYPQERTLKIIGLGGDSYSEIVEDSQNNVVLIPPNSSITGCEYSNSCFKPNPMVINSGETLTWQNQDLAAHTITSGNSIDGLDGMFDSGLILSGGSFQYMFYSSGTYDFFCMIHPWMEGSVTVVNKSESENEETSIKDKTTNIHLPTQVTLEYVESAKEGQVIYFSGYLTSYGNPVSNVPIQIKDEDMLDTDDLLESGMTESDGGYSISWMVKDVESNDRKTITKLMELHPSMQGVSMLNSILNIMEANTVEVFAEFEGTTIHEKSDTCKQNTQYGTTYNSCNNNIIIITDGAADTLEKKIAESLLRKMMSQHTTDDSDIIFSILYENEISKSTIDDFTNIMIEDFFLQIASSNMMPEWVDNIKIWYDNEHITKQDLLYLIQFLLDKKTS